MKDCVEDKRLREQRILEEMIRLYCRKQHPGKTMSGGACCPDCQALLEYAKGRSQKCPFMEEKTFCSNCKVHCYKPEMRQRIRQVMAFSGPRMLLYHPGMAVWHLVCRLQNKRKR